MHITVTILERSLIIDEDSMTEVEAHLLQKFPARSVARAVQSQVKLILFEKQQLRVLKFLKDWEAILSSAGSEGQDWEISFCVFLILAMVLDKVIGHAYFSCEFRIEVRGFEPTEERKKFSDLVTIMETYLFEKCKEIFHHRYGTRQAGDESFNPIRDGIHSWKRKPAPALKTIRLVQTLRRIIKEHSEMQTNLLDGIQLTFADYEIRTHPLRSGKDDDEPFLNAGRLACIFLNDFSKFN